MEPTDCGMLFNSLVFAIFLPLVYVVYWALGSPRVRAQNALLLIASYIFYGWWDYRFLALVFGSSLVDYLVSLGLARTEAIRRRRWLLSISLTVNLGTLAFFKYFNFFVDSAVALLQSVGLSASMPVLHVILPVGISFYTFQTLSYAIDVYRRELTPTKDPIAFFAFVSFFPQLVAGPIERASALLPQFLERRVFQMAAAKDGLRQMLWGFFKKVVIADNIAPYVSRVFGHPDNFGAPGLAIGAILFAFQIYCDFSGYSDIAIGCGRLFGIRLMRNFAYPYFARDVAEFWRRWHISLSTWFRDYLYIPLGGNRGSIPKQARNVFVTFTLSGLWHGASWTFVVWGFLHSLFYLPLLLRKKRRRNVGPIDEGRYLPRLGTMVAIATTFTVTTLAWVFFRAKSLGEAMAYFGRAVSHPVDAAGLKSLVLPLSACVALAVIEWVRRDTQHVLEIQSLPVAVRWAIYYAIIAGLLFFGKLANEPFIYFQF